MLAHTAKLCCRSHSTPCTTCIRRTAWVSLAVTSMWGAARKKQASKQGRKKEELQKFSSSSSSSSFSCLPAKTSSPRTLTKSLMKPNLLYVVHRLQYSRACVESYIEHIWSRKLCIILPRLLFLLPNLVHLTTCTCCTEFVRVEEIQVGCNNKQKPRQSLALIFVHD